MNHQIPRTPFSTSLSRSARETELRLRNIFSGPKKRPPVPFLALVFALCLLCGNLVSCQTKPAEGPAGSQGDVSASSQPEPAPALTTRDLAPDLNRNGVPEEVRLVTEHRPSGYTDVEVQFWEGETLIDREVPGVFLCTLEGKDYILRCYPDEYQGSFQYSYHLADLSGEFEETAQWNSCSFDINFSAPFHREFIPEDIAAYVEELNDLMAHSVRLSNGDGKLVVESGLYEHLHWLDDFPDSFTRDPDQSLLENLNGFLWAMTQNTRFTAPQPVDALPIDAPLDMRFSSGVGGWATELTLNPDGSFTGLFVDSDMGSDGYTYPNGTRYVCQFHGSFGEFGQLTGASWSLTLEELVLDSEHPVGEEEIADGVLYIYSEPYGFDDQEGKALKPGARFILYSPEAQGHAPGTELYGAYEFWSWWPDRSYFTSASDTLGCWGLHSLETGDGFFSYGA